MPQPTCSETSRTSESHSSHCPDKASPSRTVKPSDDGQSSPSQIAEQPSHDAPLNCTLTVNNETIDAELIDLTRRAAKLNISQAVRFAEKVTLRVDAPRLNISVEMSAKVGVVRPLNEERWFVNCTFVAIPKEVLDALASAGLIQRRHGSRHAADMHGTARLELEAETVSVRLKDCSASGFCVVATKPGTIGASVVVELDDGTSSGGGRFFVSGQICWQIAQDGSHLLGCSITGDRNRRYLNLIRHERAEGEPLNVTVRHFHFRDIAAGFLFLILAGGSLLALAFMVSGIDPSFRAAGGTELSRLPVSAPARSKEATINKHHSDKIEQPRHTVLLSENGEEKGRVAESPSTNMKHPRPTFDAVPSFTPFVDDIESSPPNLTVVPVDESVLLADEGDHDVMKPIEPDMIDETTSPLTFTTPRELSNVPPQFGNELEFTPIDASRETSFPGQATGPIEIEENSKEMRNAAAPQGLSTERAAKSNDSEFERAVGAELNASIDHAADRANSPKLATPVSEGSREAPRKITTPSDQAETASSTSSKKEPKPTRSNTRIAADEYMRGSELYRSRRFMEAIAAFSSAVRTAPNETLYRYLLAMSYYQLNRSDKAESTIRAAIAFERKHPMLDQGRRLSRFDDAAGRWVANRRSMPVVGR